jgi:hypothetical protein
VYNPATDSWMTREASPTSMPFAGCASVPGGAVVVGGTSVYCPVLRYNRDDQRDRPRWENMSPLQTPRLHAAVAGLGPNVYVMVRCPRKKMHYPGLEN